MPIPNMKEIASGEVFKNFYRDNFIYVDKTEKVLAMIKKGRAFCLDLAVSVSQLSLTL